MDIKILLGKTENGNFYADAQELVTGRTCVIAQSGAGKSYLIGVICEQLLKNNIAFCIIDTEGEYFSLKEKFQILWIGKENSDIDIDSIDFKDLTEKIVNENIPVILDISDVVNEREIVEKFTTELFNTETRLKKPYLLIVEEADKFVPQGKNSIKKIEEISRRGRKRGLGILIATQRPALVNKNVLSQCGNQFIGKLSTENDISAVNLFFENRRELEELPKLRPGEFFVMGNITDTKKKIKVIKRETKHKGLTPSLMKKPIGKISEVISSVKKSDMNVYNSIEEISTEDLNDLVERKRKKKFILFGEKEKILNIKLGYIPLYFVRIKSIASGLIKNKIKEYSFILSDSGNFVKIQNGIDIEEGFSSFLGLKQKEAEVLFELIRNRKGLTVSELELKTNISRTTLNGILKSLFDKKLITYRFSGRSKIYMPILYTKIPDIKREEEFPKLNKKIKEIKANLTEEKIRELVKALDANSEVVEFKKFYYPIFEVKTDRRIILFDGVKGKEIKISGAPAGI